MSSGSGLNIEKIQAKFNQWQNDYNDIFNRIDTYQSSGVETVANAWISPNGKQRIDEVTNRLNVILSNITAMYTDFYNGINDAVTAIANKEGASFTPYNFSKSSKSFTPSGKEIDSSGNINFDRDKAREGYEAINSYVVNVLNVNLTDMEESVSGMAYYLAYGTDADVTSMNAEIQGLTTALRNMISEGITPMLNNWESEFESEYSMSAQTVQNAQGDIGNIKKPNGWQDFGNTGGNTQSGNIGGYTPGGNTSGGYTQSGNTGGYTPGGYTQSGNTGGYTSGGYTSGGYTSGGYTSGGYTQSGNTGGYTSGGYSGYNW